MCPSDRLRNLGQGRKSFAGVFEPRLSHDNRMRPAAPLPHQPRARPERQIGLQEIAYGGLSKATQRKLAALTRELKVKGSVVVTRRRGSRLEEGSRSRSLAVHSPSRRG